MTDRDPKTTHGPDSLAAEDTRPGSPRGKRRSSASQLRAVVCVRCADYRQTIATLESQLEREAAYRLAAERNAQRLADELNELRRSLT